MKKVICYIDGYNLFHALENNPSAKINLLSLAKSLVNEGHKLVEVYYFSAYATWKPENMIKHREYVKILEETGVKVVMSHFKRKDMKCNNCKSVWVTHEEKETDVKLSLQILKDAEDDKFDVAYLLSGDSDIVPAIVDVRERHPEKRILAVLPKFQVRHARDIIANTHGLVALASSKIKKYLFECN
ncbi:MAG: NYN domain-containing protein [Candidatus Pacebacteria bacterium]|nr:NYN domain-containing protein [Candidatus Paceibacterota bacterium]